MYFCIALFINFILKLTLILLHSIFEKQDAEYFAGNGTNNTKVDQNNTKLTDVIG